jgi:ribosomal protein L4
MASYFEKLGLAGQKILFLFEGRDINLVKSIRNLPYVKYQRAGLVNAYNVLNSEVLLLTKKAHKTLEEVLTG